MTPTRRNKIVRNQMKARTADEKESATKAILDNPVYPPDSESMVSLRMALYRLSLEELNDLLLVITAKR